MLSIPDIATLTRLLTQTNTVNLSNANLLILINAALDRIHGKILSETGAGKWPPGDINFSAFPTYTQNLVNSQAEYSIDSLAAGTYASTGGGRHEPLVILGVEVVDNAGNSHVLEPITLKEIHRRGIAQSEFMETDGRPLYYEKREHMVVLYPAPDNGVSVTLTAGLRIFYLRNAGQLDNVTDSDFPGFPSPYHDLVAYMAAYDYAIGHGLSNVNHLGAEVVRKEKELMRFIAMRNTDDEKVMSTQHVNPR